jgi:hypothetical protein
VYERRSQKGGILLTDTNHVDDDLLALVYGYPLRNIRFLALVDLNRRILSRFTNHDMSSS